MFKAIKEFFFGKPVEVQPTVADAPYKVETPVAAADSSAAEAVAISSEPVVVKPTRKPRNAKPAAKKTPAAPRKPRAKKPTV